MTKSTAERNDGSRRPSKGAVFSIAAISGTGDEMLFTLFSSCAVGLAIVVFGLTVVIPFVLGIFDRREIP